jgi:hypothetical protein
MTADGLAGDTGASSPETHLMICRQSIGRGVPQDYSAGRSVFAGRDQVRPRPDQPRPCTRKAWACRRTTCRRDKWYSLAVAGFPHRTPNHETRSSTATISPRR